MVYEITYLVIDGILVWMNKVILFINNNSFRNLGPSLGSPRTALPKTVATSPMWVLST